MTESITSPWIIILIPVLLQIPIKYLYLVSHLTITQMDLPMTQHLVNLFMLGAFLNFQVAVVLLNPSWPASFPLLNTLMMAITVVFYYDKAK